MCCGNSSILVGDCPFFVAYGFDLTWSCRHPMLIIITLTKCPWSCSSSPSSASTPTAIAGSSYGTGISSFRRSSGCLRIGPLPSRTRRSLRPIRIRLWSPRNRPAINRNCRCSIQESATPCSSDHHAAFYFNFFLFGRHLHHQVVPINPAGWRSKWICSNCFIFVFNHCYL